MKKYDIAIDFESYHAIVEAESKEEAENKAMEGFSNLDDKERDYWVGDISEEK